jgi:RNA polymerase sigma factor (sigma-70 family)
MDWGDAMDDMETLVRKAAGGDQEAWRILVQRHNRMLFAVGRSFRLTREQIEDVVQDTWLQLFRHVDDIREPTRLAGWLKQTMRRGCMHARLHYGREVVFEDWRWLTDSAPDVEAQMLQKEQEHLLWKAVRRLPGRQGEILMALAATDSYADVGTTLGIPIGAIGPTRARAVRRLRLQLA